jgi:hypothetical protein
MLIGALILSLSAQSQVATDATGGRNYEFAHGRWFDGQKFVARRFYSVGGILTAKRPAQVERVFDLAGKYVVPPFGEAHNHNLDWSSPEQFARIKRMYLEGGVFYIKNPNSLPRSRQALAGKINIPSSKDDEAKFGWKGLDPALLPHIVRRAHQDGLRVSNHVETATDFHNALIAGATAQKKRKIGAPCGSYSFITSKYSRNIVSGSPSGATVFAKPQCRKRSACTSCKSSITLRC